MTARAPADFVLACVRPEIRALSAYEVAHAEGMIKLDAMENPFPLPPAIRTRIAAAVAAVPVNRYPDGGARGVKAALRTAFSIPDSLGLILGNGSDELIQIITTAVAKPGAAVLAPEPSFAMYRLDALFAGMRYVGVPLRADFALDGAAMRAAIEHERPALVFLAYPNNPTGNLFDEQAIETLLCESPGLVVADEAYHAFAQRSFMDRLGQFDNLLVMRTLSKQGLAGLRLGILAGDPAWLAEFDKLRLPYNINSLTQASAEFALQHMDVLDEQAARLRAERERLLQELAALTGVRVWPSAANFILFRTDASADAVFAALRQQGVLIKNLSGAGGVLTNCLRVTVGTPHENAAFLAALRQAL